MNDSNASSLATKQHCSPQLNQPYLLVENGDTLRWFAVANNIAIVLCKEAADIEEIRSVLDRPRGFGDGAGLGFGRLVRI